MGDEGPYSVANAILQATAALNNVTRVAERQQESVERLTRGVEEGNVQHLTFSSRTTIAVETLAAAYAEQAKQTAVLASAVQALTPLVAEAKAEAARAAENSSRPLTPPPSLSNPEPGAPRHGHSSEDSAKTSASVARKAWHDLLYAPGRGQIVALAVVFIAALTFLGYLAIKNNLRAAEMEHAGEELRQHQLRGP